MFLREIVHMGGGGWKPVFFLWNVCGKVPFKTSMFPYLGSTFAAKMLSRQWEKQSTIWVPGNCQPEGTTKSGTREYSRTQRNSHYALQDKLSKPKDLSCGMVLEKGQLAAERHDENVHCLYSHVPSSTENTGWGQDETTSMFMTSEPLSSKSWRSVDEKYIEYLSRVGAKNRKGRGQLYACPHVLWHLIWAGKEEGPTPSVLPGLVTVEC